MDKITLDMDFGNDTNQDEDVEKPKLKRTDEEKKEYVLDLINEGLGICENNAKNISKVIEETEKFLGYGIDEYAMTVMHYLKHVFENNIPDLLRGNYDELIPQGLSDSDAETDLLIELLKTTRKNLLKSIEDNKNNN